MKIFGNKNGLSPDWKYSQKGNLWKFIFAGKNKIAGETRDIENKKLYLFTLDVSSGKPFLKNYLFEDGNYWISIEGANDNTLYISRFQSPELPYPKNVIAIDIKSGNKLWENNEHVFHFCTDEKTYGLSGKSGKVEYCELNNADGTARQLSDGEKAEIAGLKERSDHDLFTEYYNYPKPHSAYPADDNCSGIFKLETGKGTVEGDIEYIIRKNLLMFNYYLESGIASASGRKIYKNIFCIYDSRSGEKLFEDILNENSNYNVPDNFFVRDDRIYYLKGNSELLSINLSS